MTQLGLCVSPGYIPTKEELVILNPPFLRSILLSLEDAVTLKNTGKPLVITLNNQCKEVGSDWTGWRNAVKDLIQILGKQLIILGCGNEFDLYWHENKSNVPPEFAADLLLSIGDLVFANDIRTATTSVAGPEWPEYLSQLSTLLNKPKYSNIISYYDIHPYGQRPRGWIPDDWGFGYLTDMIKTARNITRTDNIICTEYGVKLADAGNETSVAAFLQLGYNDLQVMNIPYASWFCYTDSVGAASEQGEQAFGLKTDNNRYKPAWHKYAEINKGQHMVTDNYDKWKNLVGFGLLNMMREDNTEPAMASEWRPFDRPAHVAATIEQCIGLNNVTYCWNINTDSGWRIRPSQF